MDSVAANDPRPYASPKYAREVHEAQHEDENEDGSSRVYRQGMHDVAGEIEDNRFILVHPA
jgi:hypothetical protein